MQISFQSEKPRPVRVLIYGFGRSKASACVILAAIHLGISRPIAGLRGSALVALIGVALYTLLVGADAAVIRAAIMGSLFIIAARFMGRPTYAPAALFAAAVPMTSEPDATAITLRRQVPAGMWLVSTPDIDWHQSSAL